MAIIGTGATAIQCVPFVGKYAKQLYVFQRTPSSVDVRGNKPTDLEWAKTLKPGWQRERRENFNNMVIGVPVEEDLVDDGWTDIFRNLGIAAKKTRAQPNSRKRQTAMLMEIADFQKMNGVRARVDETVADPATAEALKPWYRQFCKRPTFNDDYLPTFNRPNVKLVDISETQGVERITKTGVVANGVEYPVDCIIFATGFEVGTAWTRRAGYEVIGMDEQTLTDYWADGMKTYHGFSSHGFPNCFLLGHVAERRFGEPDLGARRPGAARRLHHQAGDGPRAALLASELKQRRRSGSRKSDASRWSRRGSCRTARPATTTTKAISEKGSTAASASIRMRQASTPSMI